MKNRKDDENKQAIGMSLSDEGVMDKEHMKDALKEGLNRSTLGSDRIEIPVYESFEGKTVHGEKTWETTEKEKKTARMLAILFIVPAVIMFIPLLRPDVPLWIAVLLFILSLAVCIGIVGGYIFYVAYRRHKEDPIDMHYYDVAYKHNYLTGDGVNNTREITKDEFFHGQ